MDLENEMLKVVSWIAQIGNLVLGLLWHILHLILSLWYFAVCIAHALESSLISGGILKRYKALNLGKVQYLAIVVDSEEAHQTSKVIELLQWLTAIGVKNVCLYDIEGVLKKSKEAILERLNNAKLFEEATKNDPLLDENHITLEFASFSDGKEAVAKAANLLFVKYYSGGDQEKPIFTESHVAEALRAIGSGGPDPDLLLVYGPARCHMGFPAWRIRYTEIVHMGPLKSMKYGSLIKAIHKFTMIRQNYGK
uniref:ditrans,polycis-polyprenyl diphosphate synthase [(2E,6E)-farnesyldiphosphate specific] n=1 Tax=Davidia involucrata TaxID=16924 RepID=A0A5B7ALD7_DAVIN